MKNKGNRLFRSFGYAIEGIKDLFSYTPNARLHLVSCICVCLLAWYLEVSHTEWLILLLCCMIVLMAEAFNTSIEYLTDLAQPENHPLAKKTKDVAAAAVLITASFSAIIGAIVFIPKLFTLLAN